MKKTFYKILIIVFCLILSTGCFKKSKNTDKNGGNENPGVPDVKYTNNFNIDLIKVTRRDKNYLISPYSIEVALNMLSEGANNNTKKEIKKIIPDRNINDVSIKNKVKIANALFVKDSYKDKVKKNFKDILTKNYNSEILYDEFKTPDVINNWVNKKTDGMIKKILDDMDPDFAIGLANAIAIDVKWASEFECSNTTKEKFTKNDGKKINVEMMHNSYEYGAKYLKSNDATGIIIPYQSYNKKTGEIDYEDGTNLEFIGILPNTDVESYISSLDINKLNKLIDSGKKSSRKYEINLSLPRFKYEYEVPNFIDILKDMGINDAFDFGKADFTSILDKKDMKSNLYVSDAIHKTYIDLNESGTKAAAVTYFGMKDMAAILEEEKETVEIKFNKPFVYMIRDSKTGEILFFGAVYEPSLWNGTTCKE